MTVTNGYITLAELRAAFVPAGVTGTGGDTRYEKVIEAASREVEKYCHRRFYGLPETRYYSPNDYGVVEIDDLRTLTTLKTDDDGDGTYETTWQSGDYELSYAGNYNAALDDKPYTQIEAKQSGSQSFPVSVAKSVLVSGVFGYVAGLTAATSCPSLVHEATLLASMRFLARKDTPLGIAGNPVLGEQRVIIPSITLDPDIKAMLDPFKRWVK